MRNLEMAKFEVQYSWTTSHSRRGTLKITKAEVVEEMELDSEDAQEWKDHVQEFVENMDQEELEDRLTDMGDPDDDDYQDNFLIDSVEEDD
jgi:hypothetical protein